MHRPFRHFEAVRLDGSPLGTVRATSAKEARVIAERMCPSLAGGGLHIRRMKHPDDGWFCGTTLPNPGAEVFVTTASKFGVITSMRLQYDGNAEQWRALPVVAWRPAKGRHIVPLPFSCGPVWRLSQ